MKTFCDYGDQDGFLQDARVTVAMLVNIEAKMYMCLC